MKSALSRKVKNEIREYLMMRKWPFPQGHIKEWEYGYDHGWRDALKWLLKRDEA